MLTTKAFVVTTISLITVITSKVLAASSPRHIYAECSPQQDLGLTLNLEQLEGLRHWYTYPERPAYESSDPSRSEKQMLLLS
jgi:hypothetical protein